MRTGGTDQRPGCAACKFLERTCLPDCGLAPHFPPESEPHFADAKVLLDIDSPVESVLRHSHLLDHCLNHAETIARAVTVQGNYNVEAMLLLTSALLDEAFGPLGSCRTRTMASTSMTTVASTSTTSSNESPASLYIDELLKIFEEPVVRRGGGRELTPADAAVMGRIWDSFVEAMELPLPLAVMELQQIGVLASDDDSDEAGSSNQDREEEKEESSLGTKNEGGGNNHDDIA